MTVQHRQHVSLTRPGLELDSGLLASSKAHAEICSTAYYGIQDMACILINDMDLNFRVLGSKGTQCIRQEMVCNRWDASHRHRSPTRQGLIVNPLHCSLKAL
ncbi:hypothetical protein CtesDRAFT_PD1580 [Comamonas testosteroni KF-1]|uniref:Uncharacterized protein n=1 Tax=Comamonas testosteroni (strain DSM 14576 / KF-1) TaxID=399795 RepID=B7X2S2_COMTK|nr:hypothetical protein CtesDRAFT_PD1580 [Comamonas testosteroni KF-1]